MLGFQSLVAGLASSEPGTFHEIKTKSPRGFSDNQIAQLLRAGRGAYERCGGIVIRPNHARLLKLVPDCNDIHHPEYSGDHFLIFIDTECVVSKTLDELCSSIAALQKGRRKLVVELSSITLSPRNWDAFLCAMQPVAMLRLGLRLRMENGYLMLSALVRGLPVRVLHVNNTIYSNNERGVCDALSSPFCCVEEVTGAGYQLMRGDHFRWSLARRRQLQALAALLHHRKFGPSDGDRHIFTRLKSWLDGCGCIYHR